jgi:hypothetical protein
MMQLNNGSANSEPMTQNVMKMPKGHISSH